MGVMTPDASLVSSKESICILPLTPRTRWTSPSPSCNTRRRAPRSSGDDELATPDQLGAFLLDQQLLRPLRPRRRRARRGARRPASACAALWTLDRDEAAVEVNAMLARCHGALPYLMRHDGFDWHLHATGPGRAARRAHPRRGRAGPRRRDPHRRDRPPARRAPPTTARACCVDLSRNGSKRFCSVRCGNRMNMVAFRRRQEV